MRLFITSQINIVGYNQLMANLSIEPHYEMAAGALCLNFVNTVWERVGFDTSAPSPPHELLFGFDDVLKWAECAEILPKPILDGLGRAARADQGAAQRAYKRLLDLRETLFGVLFSLCFKRKALAQALEELNRFLEDLPFGKLELTAEGIVLKEGIHKESLCQIEIAICRDATELLTSANLDRLRFCAAEDCGWVFLDTSKNNKRRWCSMSDCGNREKVSRFFRRKRDEG